MKQTFSISAYLAVKEVWRNRGRFLLVSLVIALITLLVLFIAALGEGLGNGNREYISKLDGQLIVYQAKSDFLISASRLAPNQLAAVKRVEGVADAGMIGTSSANLVLPAGESSLKVALIGVQPGHVGEPRVMQGNPLSTDLSKEAILDKNTAIRSGLKIGDTLTLRVTQGTKDEFYSLKVVGISDGELYSLQPAILSPSTPGTVFAPSQMPSSTVRIRLPTSLSSNWKIPARLQTYPVKSSIKSIMWTLLPSVKPFRPFLDTLLNRAL